MIDGGLRNEFIKRLKPLNFHCQGIETGGTGLGVPDLNYCAGGIDGWVEFKKTTAWAVSNILSEQVGWILRRKSVGGRVYVAVRRKCHVGKRTKLAADELWLIDGKDVITLRDEGLKSTNLNTLGVWEGGPSKWDWTRIANLLTE